MNDIYPQKLLVEGSNDEHVVKAICKKYDIKKNFNVENKEGLNELLKVLPQSVRASDIKAVGVVIDADRDPVKAIKSVGKALSNYIGSDELSLQAGGSIVVLSNKVRFGLWVMPNNSKPGMLEDFIMNMIPERDELMPLISEHLDRVESCGLNRYNASLHRSKAEVHSWLAIQETPGLPMGKAIGRKMLSADESNCRAFADWLGELFG